MKTIYILIDYDNFFFEDNREKDDKWVSYILNLMISKLIDNNLTFDELLVRFYGGWLENQNFTPLASKLLQAIEGKKYFPMVHPQRPGTLRGRIELVTSLLAAPDAKWEGTLRRKKGLPRLRLDTSEPHEVCNANAEICPIKIFHKFSKATNKECKVPGCNTVNSKAFISVEQKMVDSMIVCDLIELSLNPTLQAVFILSDDSDLLPGVVAASAKGKKIYLYYNNKQFSQPLGLILDKYGVLHQNWEGRC